jgi:hypothetical protein
VAASPCAKADEYQGAFSTPINDFAIYGIEDKSEGGVDRL